MENKEGKKTTRRRGMALLLCLCLVGAAAFGTFYAMSMGEKEREQAQISEQEQARIEEANAAKSAENEKDTEEAEVNGSSLENEMEEDPADLVNETEDETEEKTEETEVLDAGSSNVEASVDRVISPTVNFTENDTLTWPVAGNVVLDYSMDSSVYFPTLNQYKYNPALIIGAEEGSQVLSATKGIVKSVDIDEEIGNTVTMNIGNGYELVYGQLKEVTVAQGDVVETGSLIGYISEPTKYYCEEGSNLFFEMKKDGEPVDPFLYLE